MNTKALLCRNKNKKHDQASSMKNEQQGNHSLQNSFTTDMTSFPLHRGTYNSCKHIQVTLLTICYKVIKM